MSIESSAAMTYETAPAASRALKRAESGVLIDATEAETLCTPVKPLPLAQMLSSWIATG